MSFNDLYKTIEFFRILFDDLYFDEKIDSWLQLAYHTELSGQKPDLTLFWTYYSHCHFYYETAVADMISYIRIGLGFSSFWAFYFLFFFFLFSLIILIILKKNNSQNIKSFKYFCLFIIICLVVDLVLWFNNINLDCSYFYFNEQILITPLSLYVIGFAITVVIIFFFSIMDYFDKQEGGIIYEFPLIILASLIGVILIIVSNSFFLTYFALEIQSFSLYILAASKRYSNKASEAALKYFIYGSLASAIFLFGSSIIFSFTGFITYNTVFSFIWAISFEDPHMSGIFFGLFLILISIIIKLGLFPFHFWVPDVYEGVSTLVTYFFSVIPKISLFFLVLNISYLFSPLMTSADLDYFFRGILILCGVLSMFVGSVGAMYQTNIKRLLAYSAITILGLLL